MANWKLNVLLSCGVIFLMTYGYSPASGQAWGESITIDVNDSFSIEYIRYSTPMTWEKAAAKCGQAMFSPEKQHLLCFENRDQIMGLLSPTEKNFSIWLSGRQCNSRAAEKCLSLIIEDRGKELVWNFATSCQNRFGFICRKFVNKNMGNLILEENGQQRNNLKVCPEILRREILWPQSPGNTNISIKCPDRMRGYAKWYCNGTTGEWGPGPPNLANCRSVALTEVYRKMNTVDLKETAESLRQMMRGLQTGGDLTTAVQILGKVDDVFVSRAPAMGEAQKKQLARSTSKNVIQVCDELLTKSDAWNDLTMEDRHRTASTFLTAVDETGNILASSIDSKKYEISTKNVVLEVVKGDSKAPAKQRNETFLERGGNSLSVPVGASTKHVVFSFYADLREILPAHQEIQGSHKLVNSPVISANLSDGRLQGKAQVTLKHFNTTWFNSTCVFWDIRRQVWSPEGCVVVQSNNEFTICQCDHLTNFAVLMDMHCALCEASLGDRVALSVITVIGCTISILCLSVCIAIFTFYKSLWGMRVMLHRNLCICLLMAQSILLGGLDRTENKIVCACIAGFLHYFFLAAFFWMFLEAFHILWLLIKVFNPKQSHVIKFYVVGYGCPALIVIITACIKHRGYGTPQFCWLNIQDGTIWGFIGPVVSIILFNTVSLAYALFTTHRIVRNKERVHLEGVKMWIRGAAVLMPLLGVTWIVGFLYVEKNSLIFAYVFAILNTLQGLGIFLFHCLLNKKIKEQVTRSLRQRSTMRTNITPPGTRTSKSLSSFRSSSSPKRRNNSKFFVSPDHTKTVPDKQSSPKSARDEDKEQTTSFLSSPPPYEMRERLNTDELYPLEVEKG